MKVSTKQELGLLLADRRRQLGMTQQEFADHVGVPRLWVAQVETAKTNPTLSRLLLVVRRAGLSLNLDAPSEHQRAPQDNLAAEQAGPLRGRVDLDEHLSRFGNTGRPRA